ncbi:hypothetical protein [Calothrix sp. NIES-3974]|uniref:hypothetical protein n=1 Tax=Calothrix sp. NIES-3974 TaxID=2005462 RepID=UPI000B6089D7|nr:hypothetical protein [Calothrix sp. NIES-3974]BAZ07280.1 hypothetical protein NIES3974_39430 [Calothrix sp. NIES-3974]
MQQQDINPDMNIKNPIPQYPVSIWEAILIFIGAIALMGTGLAWIGMRMFNNTFNPVRAEKVARSLVDYQIPGGSTGVLGLSIGAETFAIVKRDTEPSDVFLYVSKAPSDRMSEETPINLGDAIALENSITGEFIFSDTYTEAKTLCNQATQVTIQKGEQIDTTRNSTQPAIQYSARITDGHVQRVISIMAIGDNTQAKAEQVFNSIKCI